MRLNVGCPEYADGGCDIYNEAIGPAPSVSPLEDLPGDFLNGLWNEIVLRSGEEKEVLAAPRAG